MHAGRQLPRRLSPASGARNVASRRTVASRRAAARALGIAAALALSAGCASSRYVGSVGTTGVYGNLGYGLTLNLHAHELSARWKLIDPENIDTVSPELRPEDLNEPLDLDGDGVLAPLETTRHLRPTLRLLARSSSAAGARIDIDVVILGGAAAKAPLDDVARGALRELIGPTTTATAWQPAQAARAFDLRATSGQTADGAYRLAVIDHVGFAGEASATPRRQSVRVLLRARALTPALLTDFSRVLDVLSLASAGGPVAPRDRW